MFVYISIFVLAVLWLGIALITLYLFGKYSDLIKEYQKLKYNNEIFEFKE